jgi:hypothetical protein
MKTHHPSILTLPAAGAVRQFTVKFMRALFQVLRSATEWLVDHVPRALGLRVMPGLLPERTRRNELKLPVRGYSQLDAYSCGVAAGWSVLRYCKRESHFREFDTDCAPSRRTGTSTRNLYAALRRHGLRVFPLRDLDFEAITTFLKSGYPIFTTIREPHWKKETHHWAVIYGFGWRPRRMYFVGRIGIPGFTKRALAWRKFKSLWTGRDDSLVCIPNELVARRTTTRKARKIAAV